MKRPAVALLPAMLVAVAWGQYLEATITLPDSLGSQAWLTSIAYNPLSDRIYLGDDCGSVVEVDPGTGVKLGRIQVDSGQPVHYLLSVPGMNKLYAWTLASGPLPEPAIRVIDCGVGRVVREIPVPGGAGRFCGFDTLAGRAYYVNFAADHAFAAIDFLRDTVVASFPTGNVRPTAACFNSRGGKVYFMDTRTSSREVVVVDARGDSVLRTITTPGVRRALGYSPVENKVYCGPYVFDGEADTLIHQIAPALSANAIVCNPDANKMYFGGGDATGVAVVDASSDSIIAGVQTCTGLAEMMYCSADSNVYVAYPTVSWLAAIDGRGDTLVTFQPAGASARYLASDPSRNRVFCAAEGRNVLVVQGRTATPVGVVYTGLRPMRMCYSAASNKLYVTNRDNLGSVAIVDCRTNRVLRNIPVWGVAQSVSCSPSGDKVYCAVQDWGPSGRIVVIDGTGDSIARTIATARVPVDVCFDKVGERAYCGHTDRDSVSVIDAVLDSVEAMVLVSAGVGALSYSPQNGKLYCTTIPPFRKELCVIDCTADSLLAVLPVSGGASPEAFFAHGRSNKMYFASDTLLRAVEMRADTLLRVAVRMNSLGDALCWNSRDNKLYWAGWSEECYVRVVDCTADTIVAEVGVGGSPHGLFYDSTNNWVFCTLEDSAAVAVLDGATNRLLRTIPVGATPNPMAFSSVERRLYVANTEGSSLSVISTATPGVADGGIRPPATRGGTMPTVVTGLSNSALVPFAVYDATGRRVTARKPGPNDVRRLAPGVYFLRLAFGVERSASGVTKVVVSR